MQFEAGKWYSTARVGRAYCIGQDDIGRWWFRSFRFGDAWSTVDGENDKNRDYSIIGPWQEPVTVTRWWFAYADAEGHSAYRVLEHRHDAETHHEYHSKHGRRVGPIEEITTVVP